MSPYVAWRRHAMAACYTITKRIPLHVVRANCRRSTQTLKYNFLCDISECCSHRLRLLQMFPSSAFPYETWTLTSLSAANSRSNYFRNICIKHLNSASLKAARVKGLIVNLLFINTEGTTTEKRCMNIVSQTKYLFSLPWAARKTWKMKCTNQHHCLC